jgi:MFS superfamily sulfate permease-like transporter
LVIASTQLPKLFGITTGGNNFFTRLLEIFRHLGETNLPTLAVGLVALLLLILGDRFLPGRPVSLFVVVAAILMMSFFPLADRGVKTVGLIPAGLPKLSWPLVHWNELDDLLALALACFLLSYVESISVVRTFALKHRYAINADQELLALGAANLAAGVGQGFPVAGGMSQSAVNEKAGAKTPLALVFSSAGICAVLLFLTGLMRNLPQPVLAAVVLFAVGGLVRPREIRFLYRADRTEFRIAMVATFGVLLFGILKGVLLAAIFSILLLLKHASHPRIAELKRLPTTGRFVDCSRYPEADAVSQALVLRVESGLFYFNAQNVRNYIARQIEDRVEIKLVVVDLSTSANVDLAGARMLAELEEYLTQAGISLKLAETHGDVRDVLHAQGLEERVEGVEQRSDVEALIESWRVSTVGRQF